MNPTSSYEVSEKPPGPSAPNPPYPVLQTGVPFQGQPSQVGFVDPQTGSSYPTPYPAQGQQPPIIVSTTTHQAYPDAGQQVHVVPGTSATVVVKPVRK